MTREAMQMALEALECIPASGSMLGVFAEQKRLEAITVLRQTLEQISTPVFEPKNMIPAKEFIGELWVKASDYQQAIIALRQALEQPADEPVAWMLACAMDDFRHGRIVEVSRGKEEPDDIPLYSRPQPAAQFVGLTEDELSAILCEVAGMGWKPMLSAIEAKLKEKNT